MYTFPPPHHTDKTFASAVRAPSSDHSTHNGNQSQNTADRYLPSLLHTTASAPPTQNLQQSQQHPPGPLPVQGIQHPLNNILLQTAQFMAMNEQLRKEIEQYANLRCDAANTPNVYSNDMNRYSQDDVYWFPCWPWPGPAVPLFMMTNPIAMFNYYESVRAASLKGGTEAQVAAAAAAAYFLAPPVGPHGAPLGTNSQSDLPPSLVAPFGGMGNVSRLPPPGGRKSPLPDSYKTVMCQAWLEAAMCSFGENCRFAHGEHELRPMTQPQRANRKYKTKLCEKYTNTGLCPYGTRCLFIHPDNTGGNNAYIRPDKLEELKKRQQNEGEGTKKGEEETTKTAVTPVVVPECSSLISPPSLERERGAGDEKIATSLMTMTTSTPLMTMMMKNTGKHPVAPMMSIGVTPIRPRQSLRPHPSWPLEPSHFFDRIGGEEDEEEEGEYDEEHREMMQAAEAVAAEAAASVLMNCSVSTEGRTLHGSSMDYMTQPPPPLATAMTQQQILQHHLPRAVSPVFGLDHTAPDHSSSPTGVMDCGTPCSGSGSSSGYLSEGGCCGVITPASGLSSGTASPLDALMLSGGTHSLGSSPPSMLVDSSDFSLFHPSSSLLAPHPSAPLGMTISLPPMSSSGGWAPASDPFRTAFDIDKMAREMAKEFGGL
ncbi:moe-3 [Pristionchus pacificus]|uniref:Moe-3 n=1 Tax=Pristionchus pacificus TaxID=54126 RepID=A0A2A6CZ21_PRIPA|nr:moe-3 [Pristionchus pacificus]|eukprot:PDM83273.1 moe-3 [Pristionchus pacificus]